MVLLLLIFGTILVGINSKMNNKIKGNKLLGMTNRGVTLIELILYVAIFVVFITGVVTYGIQTINIREKIRVEQDVIFNARLVAKRIAFEIRNASSIISVTPTSITLGSADSSRNPVTIAKSGTRLVISWDTSANCPTATPCNLTSNDVVVNSLAFSNMSDGGAKSASIKYAFTMSRLNPGGRSEWSYTQSMSGNAELRSK